MAPRPIYYDTETTGIKWDKDSIIEIAAFDPENDRTFEQLINPGCPIPPEATAIHHITDEMVKDAPPFSEVARAFVEFCSGDIILIAHNNDSFDLPFIKAEFARYGVPFPEWKCFDTLKWARRYRPDLPRHTLQFLREIYGIPPNNAHRALDDVIVLHAMFVQMIDDLTIEQAHALLNKPKKLLHMPFGKHQGQPLNQIPKTYVKWLAESGAFEKEENLQLRECFLQLGLLTV